MKRNKHFGSVPIRCRQRNGFEHHRISSGAAVRIYGNPHFGKYKGRRKGANALLYVFKESKK